MHFVGELALLRWIIADVVELLGYMYTSTIGTHFSLLYPTRHLLNLQHVSK